MTNKYLKGKERIHKEVHPNILPKYLALDNQMALLRVAKNTIGDIYLSMIQEKKGGEEILMNKRNCSILAHGTIPITEKDWNRFREKTEEIIKYSIGKDKFDKLISLARHGKVKLQ